MVETRSGKMQDPAQERIQAEESAKPQPGTSFRFLFVRCSPEYIWEGQEIAVGKYPGSGLQLLSDLSPTGGPSITTWIKLWSQIYLGFTKEDYIIREQEEVYSSMAREGVIIKEIDKSLSQGGHGWISGGTVAGKQNWDLEQVVESTQRGKSEVHQKYGWHGDDIREICPENNRLQGNLYFPPRVDRRNRTAKAIIYGTFEVTRNCYVINHRGADEPRSYSFMPTQEPSSVMPRKGRGRFTPLTARRANMPRRRHRTPITISLFSLRLAFAMTINKAQGQTLATRACVYARTTLSGFFKTNLGYKSLCLRTDNFKWLFQVCEHWIAYMKVTGGEEGNYIKILLDLEPFQYFQPKRVIEGFLHIHNPVLLPSPYFLGLTVLPGNAYDIYIRPKITYLLQSPFKSNCMDYEALYLAANRTGPRTQEFFIHLARIQGSPFLQTKIKVK
ncbi:hypothetical protein LAZ67_7000792 [Cordylochernes scorpioides]|uniref:Uncharacterized protein n=1 Tax=Cordylochernes scorpioides TaxID=51811 RepID=A0ABY6KMC0_9ARAC|nr:hypothetical protein LAZ67_7000792 [Cordylochernes scorpioides]